MNNNFNFEEERDEFIKLFPIIKQDIINEFPKMKLPNHIVDYITTFLNSPIIIGGKMIRGLGFIYSFNTLISKNKNNNYNDKEITISTSKHEARVIGWCLEFLSFFLVTDDIMDNGLTRRGEPCWYRNPSPFNPSEYKVGLLAINDSVLIESFLFFLLKKYFKHKSYYVDVLELFRECIFYTATGQLLDTSSLHQKRGDFSNFNFENYSKICIYKSSYSMFYSQIKLAILLSGGKIIVDDEQEKTIEEELIRDISYELGIYGQTQDDYLDCYAEKEVLGKVGTDIQENKCCWLICKAITLSNDDQLNKLKKHYGLNNSLDVSIVKSIYNEINLPHHYQIHEIDKFNFISDKIKKLSEISPQKSEIFLHLLKRLFKRIK
ncbi:hypothetical protein DICPUDRAFT_150024 [Dictyostelium purpureum]|uniref:Farnesyl diphosphate synthase n=1 Tax=Dictyostelium purpureum TaxID=5786 RepID=F0ZF95_DICPU|nr:uncharacterized protein DICPUDRAFT_150024 [Dictyostelium purpureum]EGC37367.1 hypothetical protein DICPUDRAFT_150024 [Dictyostelium purpureum]|eukprot:XP_003286108.1 hypothetical protein DICPUDRAFT_150024 [Dictyostelium purpureum]